MAKVGFSTHWQDDLAIAGAYSFNIELNLNACSKRLNPYICGNFESMKHFFLLLFLPLVSLAQTDCSELFFSEYVEGNNNNKALEIYNPSLNPVSLANYRIIRWDNGSVVADQSPEGILRLPTNIILGPKSTYAMALNLTDQSGTGQNAPIDTALQNRVDTLLCPGCATGTGQPRVLCFNGDDALSLEKTTDNGVTWTKVDIFACIGERPTNSTGATSPTAGWTILPPYSSMPANYANPGAYFLEYWTQDKTLKRKYWVKKGITTNPAPETFNPSVQWDSLPADTYTGLRSHDCECNLLGLEEQEKLQATRIFPNPTSQSFSLSLNGFTGTVRILDMSGRVVSEHIFTNAVTQPALPVNGLSSGIYSVEITSTSNHSVNARVIKKVVVE